MPPTGPGELMTATETNAHDGVKWWVKNHLISCMANGYFTFITRGSTVILRHAACVPLCGCKLLFVTPEPDDLRVEFTFDLREDFIETRITRRIKERTTEVDASRIRTGAESSDNVRNIDREKADEVLRYRGNRL